MSQYGVIRDGVVIIECSRRDSAFRLARRLRGQPVRWIKGFWEVIA